MNVKQLSKLSKFLIFFLPIFLTVAFMLGCVFQLLNKASVAKTLEKTNQNIAYIESLDNEEYMNRENVATLKTLLEKELRYSNLFLDGFWLYKIYLINNDDGSVLNIEQAAFEGLDEEELGSQAPVEYVLEDGVENGKYTLFILECNSFIFNTPDSLKVNDEIRDFPRTLVDESNGERISKISANSLMSSNSININHVESATGTYSGDTATYSYLSISFTLIENFKISLPLSWSNWWESDKTLSSIAFKIA